MANERILECVICQERFSVKDVKEGKYYPSTGVCHGCYVKAAAGNKKVWCFGTFDLSQLECRTVCSDRKVCRGFPSK
jgi:hypothetical protein